MLECSNAGLGWARHLTWPTMWSDTDLAIHYMIKPVHTVYPIESGGSIAEMRNQSARAALNAGEALYFSMDYDMTPPPDTLQRLAKLILEYGADIASGLCYTRYPPYNPLVWLKDNPDPVNQFRLLKPTVGNEDGDYEFGDIIEAQGTGGACFMCRTAVFADLPYPWFRETREQIGDAVKVTGEDRYFFDQATSAGCKLLVDTGLEVPHMMRWKADRNLYLIWRQLEKQGMVSSRK